VRELAADLPPIVGDAAQLEQALRNVLMNAYQAMGEAGTLTVATKAVDSSVVISVADTGRGVDPEELGKVFDPFYTTRAVGEGVGLGLSVSYGIVRSHQGRLSLASRPGEGTTVTIELPCAARRRGAAGALAVL
jgi:signal transduction histidine kinase